MLDDSNTSEKVIVVDLDGTLIKTDMLFENFALFLRHYPHKVALVFLWLLKGKAYLKRRLADHVIPNVDGLPYNIEFLDWLRGRKAEGVTLVLATATDQRIADNVAACLGIFDRIIGSQERNLASTNKCVILEGIYGPGNFEYAGNSKADLAVWKSASICHVVNPDPGVLKAVRKSGKMGSIFENRKPAFKTLLKEMRVHQWAKNSLLFIPMLAAHKMADIKLLTLGFVSFLVFGICASSVYMLNDILDIGADRAHPSKKNRPLAAGEMPLVTGFILIPVLLIGSFLVSFLCLPIKFTILLAVYFFMTFAYSFWLKGIVMIDVIILSLLYTLRVIAGTAVFNLEPTFWMLAFCMFIFLSLAIVKRYTELRIDRQNGKTEKTAGRGYFPTDFELLASLGASAGYLSVLVLALFINDANSRILYRTPEWLWATCPVLLFWISRVWLLAHRGLMNDDPIIFALKDTVSRLVACLFCLFFVLAIVWPKV